MHDLSGQVLDARYRVIEPLGKGAMGSVYRGERLKLGRMVAIKVLNDEIPNEASRLRFEREAMAMAKLEHPNCATVLDVGVHDERPYVVMELVSGHNLKDLLTAAGGPLPLARAVEITRQVLSGLSHAHDHGIIHRDIKPANIVVTQKAGVGDLVKILDFGLARFRMDSSNLTGAMVIGTPNYMAPEQVCGGDLDHRVDIYACGVLLFELLTGTKPFEAADPIAVCMQHANADPPRLADRAPAGRMFGPLEDVVARALEKQRDNRFASAEDFARALVEAGARLDDTAPSPPALDSTLPVPSQQLPAQSPPTQLLPPQQPPPSPSPPTQQLPLQSQPPQAMPPQSPRPQSPAQPLQPMPPQSPRPQSPAQPLFAQQPMSSQPPSTPSMSSQPPSAPSSQQPMSSQPPPIPSSHPSPTASQPLPMASQPSPTASQPLPTASQPSPTASQPLPMSMPPHVGAPSASARSRRRVAVVAGAAGVIAVVVIAIAVASRSDAKPTPAPAAVPAPADAAPVAVSEPPPRADSDAVGALVIRALELAAGGRREPALDMLLDARKTYPQDARLPYHASILYLDKMWWADGLKQARIAIQLDPGYRSDGELIKGVLKGFNTTASYDWTLAKFLRDDIGAAAKPYLEETAQGHPNPIIRKRAARELRRYR